MHKNFNGKQPESFEGIFNVLPGTNRTKNFQIEILKSNFLAQFPTAFLPRIWNSNSLSMKYLVSHNSFKKSLYQSFVDSYHTRVNCNDPGCPDCALRVLIDVA